MREEITIQAIVKFFENELSDRCSFYFGESFKKISTEDIISSSVENIIQLNLMYIDNKDRLRNQFIRYLPYEKRLELWNFNNNNDQTVLNIDTEKSGMAFLRELLDQLIPKTEFVIKRVKVNDNRTN